jgi:GNAT superfamily N-acetyltransferase
MMVIRTLWLGERDRFRDHLLRLDGWDRYLRFGNYVSDETIEGYCARTDWFRSIAIGCFIDGELRGVVELKMVETAWPLYAEAGFSVERAFQGRGIGTQLFRRAVTAARNRSIKSIRMSCITENRRMRRIAQRVNARLILQETELEARVRIGWPSYMSLFEEAVEEGVGLLQAALAWPRRFAPQPFAPQQTAGA